jgi:hypothetical protein
MEQGGSTPTPWTGIDRELEVPETSSVSSTVPECGVSVAGSKVRVRVRDSSGAMTCGRVTSPPSW